MNRLILILSLTFIIFGCAHAVSKEYRDMADMEISPSLLLKDPDAYRGKIVILGGMIVSSVNKQEGTYVEVVEKPLDFRGIPKLTDITHGRFIVFHEEYLDTAVFSKGRYVTVAGEVIGKQIQPLGEIDYSYLLIKSKELHLLKPGEGIPIFFSIGIRHTF
jgi:outer membrane lipoprotein